MTQSNQSNRNNRNNWNGKNEENGQRQRTEEKEKNSKKVPMWYKIQNSKDTSKNSVEFKYELDGAMEKTKVNINGDGSDEEYLKMIKEFSNYLETFEMWEKKYAARIIYQNFLRCIFGATKDLWDQINTVEENEDRD